jgi:hypothetical protein
LILGGGGARQKISDNIFPTWQKQHLHIELRNERKVALLTRRNGHRNMRLSSHKWFVIGPKLERLSFTKMAKMANGGESRQHFTIKRGVVRLSVGQFERKVTKGLPMVTQFLLHNATNMSIRGVSGERKFCMWGGVLERHHRSKEAFCVLESLLCLVSPLQRS